MQRYFLDNDLDADGKAIIKGDDQKHIVNVMRMSVDDKVIVVSNEDAYIAEVTNISPEGVVVSRIGEPLSRNELPVSITIVCGLAKGDKHDFIVQKGTELGVSSIILYKAERSIVKWNDKKSFKNIERLQKIAKQAAEQCHRAQIPKVFDPITLTQLIEVANNYDVLLFADEEDAKSESPHRIADRVKSMYHEQKVLIVFGPEGGLSRKEVERLSLAGFLPVALGPRILRTETAPLYFLSAISYEFE